MEAKEGADLQQRAGALDSMYRFKSPILIHLTLQSRGLRSNEVVLQNEVRWSTSFGVDKCISVHRM